jgi:hypothetical protein
MDCTLESSPHATCERRACKQLERNFHGLWDWVCTIYVCVHVCIRAQIWLSWSMQRTSCSKPLELQCGNWQPRGVMLQTCLAIQAESRAAKKAFELFQRYLSQRSFLQVVSDIGMRYMQAESESHMQNNGNQQST